MCRQYATNYRTASAGLPTPCESNGFRNVQATNDHVHVTTLAAARLS